MHNYYSIPISVANADEFLPINISIRVQNIRYLVVGLK